MRTSNKKAGSFTTDRKPFQANNLFGHDIGRGRYAVYSYGYHWPLYVYDEQTDTWYRNITRNSQTTSKHLSQSRPDADNIVDVNVNEIKNLATYSL